MKYQQLAKDIIANVGGIENVSNVVHCITRLRFKLKNESKAKTEVLKNMDGVVTVMKSGGQYQVVIGNHVPDVYKAVVAVGGFQDIGSVEEENLNGSLFSRFIDMISSIFTPVLGILAATGMIKGFNALFVALGWLENTSGTYQILNATGDSLFYFLPIFLGYTAIKKFGGTPFIGMAIGAALVYPTLSTLTTGKPLYTVFAGTMFESPIYVTFLGIPVILMTYSSSVIPIIISSYFAAKVEKWLKTIIPNVVKTFVVPLLTLVIVVPLTFMIIGPIATWAGSLLGQGTLAIYNISPIVAGFILGGFWQVFVIFGLHWGLVPIGFNNIATLGYDATIFAPIFAASFAQIGAVLAIMIRTKNKKLKSLSIPAFISGIFGVTEPAIYGVTLPLKKPFIISCIGAAVGGAIAGSLSIKCYIAGGLGIFGIPSYINPAGIDFGFYGTIISIVVGFVLAFVLTLLFGGINKQKQTSNTTSTTNENVATNEVVSPLNGKVVALSEVQDAAFSSGALGHGIAIEPSEGQLFAPVSGKVSALFSTNHAIGITMDSGADILIHIGMDTVQLDGQFFTAHVTQGDHVEKGQLLIKFDIEEIKNAGKSLTTPILVTNQKEYNIELTKQNQVKTGELLYTLVTK
ncbi:beta-glucoside-specific PTS transporter subunit IIABC [Bacillus changyiensis]|uniref:beta-glucoside-specific PTS transporter subunit IIABC n=1 Tax=Bacillus changyiensis TaxID=3004103 RepID=UPI0022E632F7|nr:beta-glucoside-specific PTS transporter subunit IIABC [Bacillus changyiensis]MDA1478259.1 beta-glucoside-specific PTS transporter subunit IIABC [Bacillus changyiensis]